DESSEVNTNDFAFSDSSVKSSEPKPNDSTSCASTFSVSTSENVAEIESNVETPIQEPIIAGHFRKNASYVSKLCFVYGSGTHRIKDCDFYEKQMVNTTVGIGVGIVHSKNKVNHQNQFVPQAILLRTGTVNIHPARPHPVPTVKPKVFAPVPTGRHNRPFPVPTDRGYSPSENPFSDAEDEGVFDSGCSRSMTDTECLMLSKDFKLPDDSMVVLRVPRKHNLYTINLNNLCPRGNLAYLVAHASVDESMKWHRRMGHVNYKNMNRLVKGNLVRGLPSKLFKNDHTCVACCKGKQHKASYKAINAVSSITKPLQLLHMDLFGPTSIRSIDHKYYCLVITDDYSSHFKPFGCHVTILNTSDHLGKFDGKADEGYIVGYSASNKAYRVYNVPNKRVEATMNMWFLEEKPNVQGLGHELTHDATTNPAGTEPKDNYIDEVDDSPLNSADEIFQKELVRLKGQEHRATSDAERLGLGFANDAEELQKRASAETVPSARIPVPLGSIPVPPGSILVPPGSIPVPTCNIPVPAGDTLVSIDDVLVHTVEPRSVAQALEDPSWVEAMQEEMQQFKFQNVWVLVDLLEECVFYGIIDEEVYVTQPKDFVDSQHPKKVYKVVKALYGLHQAPRAWMETTPYETPKPKSKNESDSPVNVHLYRSMIGSLMYLIASRPDIMFAASACLRNQVTPTTSNLEAVKKIFKYLKDQPKLGLWYPRESPLVLEAYSEVIMLGQTRIGNPQLVDVSFWVLWIQNQLLDYGYVVPTGRVVVPTGRYVVPAGNVIVASTGRLSVIPTGRVLSRIRYINLKFLRALPSSWSEVALTLKTKSGLELLSFDDLYYKLKTLEVDVKGYTTFSSSQSAGPSHSAFKAGRKIDFDKKESARFNKKIIVDTLVDWTDHDGESYGVIASKEFDMIAGCDTGDAIEEGAAKIYNLITEADTEEASTAGEFALMGVTSKARVLQRNQLTFKDKIRVLSIELENTSNLLKHSERINADVETAKKELQTKLDNHLDDSAFSVFTTDSEDVEGRPLFNRFAKADSMKVVPQPLFGDYTSLSDHIDLDESQMSYGKSSTSSDSKSVSNDFVSCDDSDKSSEVNTNDFATSDSSVKSSEPKPNDSTSCASTSSVSTSENEAEIESNVGTPIQKPIIVQDLPSFSCNSCDKIENTSRTSCNKNGYFNKKGRNKVNHQNQFVPQAVLLRTGKVNIPPARPQPVPAGKLKVFAPVPIGRQNRPFPVPTDKGYSPSENPFPNSEDEGVFDSGCSRSMTGNKERLDDFREIQGGKVTFGGGEGRITGKGTIRTPTLDFENVYYVKELQQFNLFSISQICDKKNRVLFTDTECLVLSKDFKLPDDSMVVLRVPRKHNLYTINLNNLCPRGNLACLVAHASVDESAKWHRRMGHVSYKNMNRLVKGNLVRGLPPKLFKNDHTCVACCKGKQHKAFYKAINVVRSISEPLQLLHMDLFGPTSIRSIDHKYYCLVITDDYSRFCWVFFLEHKDETYPILKDFINHVENQVNKKVKAMRCDNGTEFKNAHIIALCGSKGIKREYSNARTPQQNGVAERKNRTLIEAARTMLADSKLPTMFWTEAVRTVCYDLNRVLVTSPHNKTPYALLTGNIPSVSHFKPFGCHVTILNISDHLGKFDGKADEGYIVGYSASNKAYRVYNVPNKRVEETMNLRFIEEKPNVQGLGHEWYFDLDYLTDTLGYTHVQANQSAGTQEATTNPAGTQDADSDSYCDDQVIIVPSYPSHNIQGTEPKDTSGDEVDDSPLNSADEIFQKELARLKGQEQRATSDAESLGLGFANDAEEFQKRASAKTVPPGSIPVPTGSIPVPSGDTMVSTDDVPVHTGSPTDSFFDDEPTNLKAVKKDFQDRKSTTGGCQFLGRRLISWQCKKQTIVATSSTEAKYVVAANCCGQILWIQNQLLDYGLMVQKGGLVVFQVLCMDQLEIDKDVVGNDMTTAQQLIRFIKNQLTAAQVPSA
nr:putative ribonuclease H-like domain-containing protein [Tanacetum cinerariifolium]